MLKLLQMCLTPIMLILTLLILIRILLMTAGPSSGVLRKLGLTTFTSKEIIAQTFWQRKEFIVLEFAFPSPLTYCS